MTETNTSNDNIKVVIRFRPQNKIEANKNGTPCVQFNGKQSFTVTNTEGNTRPPEKQDFTFDRVFDPSSTQKEVFDYVALPVVQNVLEGFNATIFAYGQTGCGKTHTMSGDITNENLKGVIPRTIEALFQAVYDSPDDIEYTIQCSFVEIYMENIRDLLNPTVKSVSIRQNQDRGIFLDPLTEVYVSSPQECLDVMAKGDVYRATAQTKMNETSSRSHSIFIIYFTRTDTKTAAKTVSRLYLVDLAGSEKVGKTGATGQTLEEAKKINSSLSALGNVINALTDGKSTHIPYRDSKLTRLLQDSLGGNAKTTLVCCTSVSSYNDSETVSTIRFGNRAKAIKNEARVNKQRSVGELEKLLALSQAENQRLRLVIKSLGEDPDADHDISGILDNGPSHYNNDTSRIDELTTSLNQLMVERDRIQEKFDLLVQETTKKDGDIEYLNQQIEDLFSMMKDLESEKEQVQTELESTRISLESLETDVETSATKNSTQYQNGVKGCSDYDSSRFVDSSAETLPIENCAQNEFDNETLLCRIDELELEIITLRDEMDSKSRALNEIQSTAEEIKTKHSNAVAKIEALTKESEENGAAADSATESLIAAVRERDELAAVIQQHKNSMEHKSFFNTAREKALNESQLFIRGLLEDRENELEKLKLEIEHNNAMALREHESFTLDTLELRKKISSLTNEKSKLQEDIEVLKSSYDELLNDSSSTALVKRIKFLTANIDELKTKYHNIYSRINDYRITVEFKNRQISSKNSFITKLTKDLEDANSRYDEDMAVLQNELRTYKIFGENTSNHNNTPTKKIVLTGRAVRTSEIKAIRGGASPSTYLMSPPGAAALTRKLDNMPLSPTLDMNKKPITEVSTGSPEPFAPPSLLCESPQV